MTASIDVTGLAHFSKSIRRAVSGDLQEEMVRSIQDAGPKMLSQMQGEASSRIEKHAVGSVTVRKARDGIELAGGQGGGLDATLFPGGEYGGRKSKRVPYATRSPNGTAYIVRRRTTMQFKPHLGKHGYFFWPTVREWMPKLAKAQEEAIDKALGAS
jgi:hypothetical protein